jgi:hypothetical protein
VRYRNAYLEPRHGTTQRAGGIAMHQQQVAPVFDQQGRGGGCDHAHVRMGIGLAGATQMLHRQRTEAKGCRVEGGMLTGDDQGRH